MGGMLHVSNFLSMLVKVLIWASDWTLWLTSPAERPWWFRAGVIDGSAYSPPRRRFLPPPEERTARVGRPSSMARCKGVRHVARPSLRTPLHDLGPSTPSPPRPRTHPARTHTYVLPALVHSFILAISHARTLQRQTTDNFKDRGGRGGRDPDQCNLTMQATSSHHYNGHHISAPWVHHHVLVCVVYVGSTHTDLDLVSAEVP